MGKKTPISFDAPASQEIVKISLRFVRKIEQSHRRLSKRSDDEALHDMRVAMRSLRSTLRAYPEVLAIRKKLKRRLKKLTSYTNPARDAEVRVSWLQLAEQELPETARKAMPEVIAYASSQSDAAYQQIDARVIDAMRVWLESIRPALRSFEQSVMDISFGNFFAERLGHVTEELDQRLHAIESEADFHAVHETRIVGKRVRYLLDPLQSDISGIKPLIKQLKKLQDLLGDFHDAQVRLDWLEETTRVMGGEVACSRFRNLVETSGRSSRATLPDPVPTLLALTRLTLRQQKHLFNTILHEQQSGHYQQLVSTLRVQAVRSRR